MPSDLQSVLSPILDPLQKQVVDLIGPATEAAAAKLQPYLEQTLKETILPRVALWGGIALVVAVTLGAIVGSQFATRRRVFRRNPRRRAYAA